MQGETEDGNGEVTEGGIQSGIQGAGHGHKLPVAPNLLNREFAVTAPNKA